MNLHLQLQQHISCVVCSIHIMLPVMLFILQNTSLKKFLRNNQKRQEGIINRNNMFLSELIIPEIKGSSYNNLYAKADIFRECVKSIPLV